MFTEDYIYYMKISNTGLSFDNWQYKADGKECLDGSTVTYSGGEMEINFTEKLFSQADERSTGYMVFIGGTPQIISLNGSEPSAMPTEMGKDGEIRECSIKFTPRLTKENIDNKDDLKITLIDIDNPLYLTTGSVEKQLDYEHYLSVPSRRTFKLEGDCEITELVSDKSFEHFPETDRAVRDYLKKSLSQLEDKNMVFFDLYSAQRADKPFLKDGKADIALLLYGGRQKNAVYKVYFYVNHEQVKVDGCDYITAELKEGFVAKYSMTLDNVKERDFVYAIAVSETNEGITREAWAMKTDTRRLFTLE